MFKVYSILTDRASQLLLPLADCSVNDASVKVVRGQHSSSCSFRWLMSRIPQRYSLSWKMPQIAAGH